MYESRGGSFGSAAEEDGWEVHRSMCESTTRVDMAYMQCETGQKCRSQIKVGGIHDMRADMTAEHWERNIHIPRILQQQRTWDGEHIHISVRTEGVQSGIHIQEYVGAANRG